MCFQGFQRFHALAADTQLAVYQSNTFQNFVEVVSINHPLWIAAIAVAIVVYVIMIIVLRLFNRDELALIPGGRKLMRFAK